MSPKTCNRVQEALARGNVWGDAVLLEHAKACDVCTRELAALKKQRDFRDAFPVLSSIADESRRSPSRTSASAREATPRSSRRHLAIMILTVVAIIGFFIQSRAVNRASTSSTAHEEDDTKATAPPRFRISNIENALFESKVEGQTVQAAMSRGIAAFYVDRLSPQQRFFLTLPDGALEVRGTRFVITIEGGKTQGVDVAEGTVALRLQGHAEILLSGGDRWPSDGSGRPTVSFMHLVPKDAAAPEASKPSD